ncbi:MAG: hypothetical protein HY253_06520 [Burkholderiales bacterium]|nr:hypothetical protein [Burkholderiales bacterium]
MTALTADRNTPHKDAEIIGFQVGANVKIFGGSLVVANAAGFAVPGLTATTVTYLGRAEESVNNLGGADGAKTVLVRRKKAFKFGNLAADLVTQADVGKSCYIVDDQTVAKTNGANTRSVAGKVLAVEPDGVWIE